jgi:hypothetical protein
LGAVFQPLRTAISLAVLAGALWAAFTVDLGGRSFAEHVDTNSETPEAEQLIEGTRSKINPTLQEVRDRVLGEYVEAPTRIPDANDTVPASTLTSEGFAARPATRAGAREPEAPELADQQSSFEQTGFEPTLPGRRELSTHAADRRKPSTQEVDRKPSTNAVDRRKPSTHAVDDASEPALPGRRRSR